MDPKRAQWFYDQMMDGIEKHAVGRDEGHFCIKWSAFMTIGILTKMNNS